MSSLTPAGGAAPNAESIVDRAVAHIMKALHRHGIHFPSVRSDLVMIDGVYAVNLGSAPAETVTALAELLDRTAVTP
jgi:hypothetical protein